MPQPIPHLWHYLDHEGERQEDGRHNGQGNPRTLACPRTREHVTRVQANTIQNQKRKENTAEHCKNTPEHNGHGNTPEHAFNPPLPPRTHEYNKPELVFSEHMKTSPNTAKLPTWLAGWLAGWLPGCLAAWLPGCLAAWLPGCLLGYLPACLPACLPDKHRTQRARWLADWLAGWLPADTRSANQNH